jgi:hypothetical protein
MNNSSSRSAFPPGMSGGSETASGVGDTTIPSSSPATGSDRILPERSAPPARRSRGMGEAILPGAATRIGGVPVSTAAGGAGEATFEGEFGDATGGVTRGTVRDANGGTSLGGTGGPIGDGTRWEIGGATGGLTRGVIGGVTTGGATHCVIGGVTTGGGTRCVIAGAAKGACGFPTIMRSRHLGHRMHAPFAPFSNASFRRYSVMQHVHLTTMTMAQPVPSRKPFPIIGRYFVKSKDFPMGRCIIEGCFNTVGQSSKELLVAQRIGDCKKLVSRRGRVGAPRGPGGRPAGFFPTRCRTDLQVDPEPLRGPEVPQQPHCRVGADLTLPVEIFRGYLFIGLTCESPRLFHNLHEPSPSTSFSISTRNFVTLTPRYVIA